MEGVTKMVTTATALKQLEALKQQGKEMRLAAEGWNQDWKVLIAIMMSAQTRDEVTIEIATSLFKQYPSLQQLSNAKFSDVLHVFKSLNYNRTKAKHVIACAKEIIHTHHGKVPVTIEELITLPGVGRKTANVFLSEIGHDGIGVDTHVSYMAQQLGWTNQKNPDKIETDLKKLFPQKHWNQVNHTLVRFGKTHQSKKKKKELLEKLK